MQRELILAPLCRYWAITELETAAGYRRSFQAAGFHVHRLEDLSDRVLPNWERGYQAALRAVSEPMRLGQLLRLAAAAVKHGPMAVQAGRWAAVARRPLTAVATGRAAPRAGQRVGYSE
jgi:hypothetical protein